MKDVINQMTSFDNTLISLMSRVMKKDREEIVKLMEGEAWYSATEAIEANLATGKAFESEEEVEDSTRPEVKALADAEQHLNKLYLYAACGV